MFPVIPYLYLPFHTHQFFDHRRVTHQAAAFEILPATNSAELRSVASLRALTADFLDSANATITAYADKVNPTLNLLRSGHR